MNIVLKSSAYNAKKVNAIKQIKELRERYLFLMHGEVSSSEWIDTTSTPIKTFYLPTLNGITVQDKDSKIELFSTRELAVEEGKRIREGLKQFI
jgi:hypothetical protein